MDFGRTPKDDHSHLVPSLYPGIIYTLLRPHLQISYLLLFWSLSKPSVTFQISWSQTKCDQKFTTPFPPRIRTFCLHSCLSEHICKASDILFTVEIPRGDIINKFDYSSLAIWKIWKIHHPETQIWCPQTWSLSLCWTMIYPAWAFPWGGLRWWNLFWRLLPFIPMPL